MRYIAQQSRLEEGEPEEEEEEEEEEWYGDEIEDYLREHGGYEEEMEEVHPVADGDEEKSGTIIVTKIMEEILDSVVQMTTESSPKHVITPPPTPLNVSGEFTDTVAELPAEPTAETTTTDLEGEYTGNIS